MASIRKRQTANGPRWDVRFWAEDGQHSETWATAADAKRRKTELETQLVRGDFVSSGAGQITVAELWRRYVASRQATGSTAAGFEATGKALEPIGQIPIADLTRDQIRAWVDGQDRSPATVHKRLAALRSALQFAVVEQLLRTNPSVGLKAPKVVPPEPVFLTVDEVDELAGAIDPAYRVWVHVSAWTGLRFGELAGLRWSDVSLERGTVTVAGQAVRNGNGKVERKTSAKTAKSRRTVVMPRHVTELLRAHQPNGAKRTDLVFPAPNGGFLDGTAFIRRFFRPAAAKAGHPTMTPHDLRHTAASLAIATGASVSQVMHMLGHSTPRLTLGLYGHLFPESGADLAARLDALWETSRAMDVP